jgi:hypothetical protein
MSEKKYKALFQNIASLPQADSISIDGDTVEIELCGTLDPVPKQGVHVFVFGQQNDISVICGEIIKYREVKADLGIHQEIFSVLKMRGRYVSFNW